MWTPRGGVTPKTLDDFYQMALSEQYSDSGIQAHLPYLHSLATPDTRVVELGSGGGDQSTVAFLAGRPKSLDCYDIARPSAMTTLMEFAITEGLEINFHHGSTLELPPMQSDVLFVDSLHTADTVGVELARFAPLCTGRILFHDILSFGRRGQCDCADQGILIAIGMFLCTQPFIVDRFSTQDNGLLTLRRVA